MPRARALERVAAELDRPGDALWFRAPGRVNLVGDHTDYNEGFVLPVAIDRACAVAARPAPTVRVCSLDAAGAVEVAADGSTAPEGVDPSWGRYVAAVVRELAARGRPAAGMDAVLASDVPLGSGLSSSAALEVGCALALAGVAGWEVDRRELAAACQAAEALATGVRAGIMDQLASLLGRSGNALLVDCRTLEVRSVRLPRELAVLAVHSGLPRTLAGSAYAERRAACEHLAQELGVRALRDATAAQVADDPLGRHVVSENARVLASAEALAQGELERFGELLLASHASLRDDFRVSTPELDLLVEELLRAGAFGARLTGAGFGGCVVAACEVAAVQDVAEAACARYRARTRLAPTAFVCRAVDGAGSLDAPTQ